MRTISITSEDDAYKYLRDAIQGKLGKDALNFEFSGWPKVTVYLGSDFHKQSLTPSNMVGFIELQKSINRTYALLKYNDSSKRLTQEEKQALEMNVKVGKGSTQSEAFLDKVAEAVANGLTTMPPEMLAITLLGAALLWAGQASFGKFLETRKETRIRELEINDKAIQRDVRIKELEHMSFVSAQENERLKLVTEAMKRSPSLMDAHDIIEDGFSEVLKGARNADKAIIQGKEIDREEIQELRINARTRSKDGVINGDFKVEYVNSSDDEVTRVKLRRASDDLVVTIDIPAAAHPETQELRDALQKAEWEKRLLACSLEVKKSGDQIRSAKIIRHRLK